MSPLIDDSQTHLDPDYNIYRHGSYFCGRLSIRTALLVAAGSVTKLGVGEAEGYVALKTVMRDAESLLVNANKLDPADAGGLLTKAGRALTKHNPTSRPGSVFPIPTGNPQAINELANKVASEILRDTKRSVTPSADGGVFFVRSMLYSNGGLKFNFDGSFVGFLEP